MNLGLILISIIVSFFGATWLGAVYNDIFQVGFGGGWIGDASAWELIIGFPLALIFFSVLLFELFGDSNRKKWMMWVLALPVLFELVVDLSHIYFPIALGLVAYGLGWAGRKLLQKKT